MLNRIKLKISNFIRKHKDKIKDLSQKIIMVAMGVFIATIILSGLSNIEDSQTDDDISNVYKPTDTVIKGSNVSEEQYKEDSNLVNTFLEFCNNGKIEEAYNLISDECKEERYSTIQEFKQHYYESIFNKKRQCNLQAWISNSKYTVYKVRYTNNMLGTGTYDENDVYQDYITLNKNGDTEKISIGSFVDSEECNIITKTNEIEATVVSKKTYISDEEYEIYIKNNTDKTILLDNLKTNTNVLLEGNGIEYGAYVNKLYISTLKIEPGKIQRVIIRFIKSLGSDNNSETIQFLNVIKDYDAYIENEETYNDVTEIKIKVED